MHALYLSMCDGSNECLCIIDAYFWGRIWLDASSDASLMCV